MINEDSIRAAKEAAEEMVESWREFCEVWEEYKSVCAQRGNPFAAFLRLSDCRTDGRKIDYLMLAKDRLN